MFRLGLQIYYGVYIRLFHALRSSLSEGEIPVDVHGCDGNGYEARQIPLL